MNRDNGAYHLWPTHSYHTYGGVGLIGNNNFKLSEYFPLPFFLLFVLKSSYFSFGLNLMFSFVLMLASAELSKPTEGPTVGWNVSSSFLDIFGAVYFNSESTQNKEYNHEFCITRDSTTVLYIWMYRLIIKTNDTCASWFSKNQNQYHIHRNKSLELVNSNLKVKR